MAKVVQDVAKETGKDALNKELNKLFPGMPAPGTPGGIFQFPFPRK
jgi:sulfur relay (sulfurtransferase) DsrC/TusE family protein